MTGAAGWVLVAGTALALAGIGVMWRRVARLERALARRPAPIAGPPPPAAIQQVGLVRFRAYHDVGGDHSFALALLDAEGNGVVLDCLYHRERCRLYAKPVRAYASPLQLTEEEVEAIDRARNPQTAIDTASLSE